MSARSRAIRGALFAGTLGGIACGTGDVARADSGAPAGAARGFALGPSPAWYVLAGPTTGYSFVAHDHGYYLGGEASVARVSDGGHFYGLYSDAAYDFGARRTSLTAGPELGYKFVGIDGGAAARFGGDRAEWGLAGRLFVTVGVVSLYGRYTHYFDALGHDDGNVVQVGLMIKLPFALGTPE